MKNPPADMTCQRVDWFTPQKVLDCVRQYALEVCGEPKIALDPCTNDGNYTRAKVRWEEDDDGLTLDSGYWVAVANNVEGSNVIWVNPPYGQDFSKWVEKVAAVACYGGQIFALYPGNRTETAYFQKHVIGSEQLTGCCYVRKRLNFCDEFGKPRGGSNPYGSVIYAYNANPYAFARHFSELGPVVQMTRLVAS